MLPQSPNHRNSLINFHLQLLFALTFTAIIFCLLILLELYYMSLNEAHLDLIELLYIKLILLCTFVRSSYLIEKYYYDTVR